MARVLIKDSSQFTHKFLNDFNTSSQDNSIFALQELSFFGLQKLHKEALKTTPKPL